MTDGGCRNNGNGAGKEDDGRRSEETRETEIGARGGRVVYSTVPIGQKGNRLIGRFELLVFSKEN